MNCKTLVMKKRLFVVLSVLACIVVVGCKSKNNPGMTIDSTQINSNGIDAITLDDGTRIIAIADVENSMDDELFKGSYDDSLLAELAVNGQFKSAINTFFIIKGDNIVLVDAGLGNDKGGQLLSKMAFLGIRPENVTAVLLTHLHTDHIGGLLNGGQPTFPNADIYLSVEEFNAWADGGALAERNGQWKEVLASYADKVNLFQDGDTLLDGLAVAMLATGHTPGHTVYQAGKCLFVGDLLHAQDLQLMHPDFCAKYDGDNGQAVTTRQRILKLVRDNSLTLCGAHCYEPFVNL